MTPLRQRLIDDLRLRNYSPRTIEAYVSRIAQFARHFGRSPDQLGMEEVRAYQLHLVDQKASWSRFNQTVCALRFLFGTTLGRPEQVPLIAFGKRQHTLPSVLAPEEVVRLFEALPAGRLRLRFQVVYACGLRLGAQIGVLLVLHTWGQNLHHPPHVHGVVTGGGIVVQRSRNRRCDTAMGIVPARLLPAGARTQPRLPWEVSGCVTSGV